MPLSEDEQRILQQIEQQFYASDPDLAGEIGTHSLYAHCLRQLRWATGGFVAGLVVLTGALFFAASFLLAFAGFVVMLATALLAERAVRKMGRAGLDQLTARFREGSLASYLGDGGQSMRARLRREEREVDEDDV